MAAYIQFTRCLLQIPNMLVGRYCAVRKGETLAGLLSTNVRKGAPEGYTKALKAANFTLPPNFGERQQTTLQPMHTWTTNLKLESPGRAKVIFKPFWGD
jgi:hypothetical protein